MSHPTLKIGDRVRIKNPSVPDLFGEVSSVVEPQGIITDTYYMVRVADVAVWPMIREELEAVMDG